jgi:signal transduction histidine kinase
LPIVHKNHFAGLLYLENNLIKGSFTSDRIEMLYLINSQIGISLENARLYSNLEEQAKEIKEMNLELENRVRERTAELSASLSKLQETQAKLVQSEKMASLGELVSGIAHEINTPLGIINSNTDLINRYVQKGNSLDEQEIDKLELINTIGRKLQTTMSACESILTIVNSLRVFARLDEAEYQSATLDSLLENTLAIMRGKLKKGIKVNTKYHYKQPVSCFPSQMNQVFINLINNAYDAMQGEGELDISVYSRDNNIVLVFRDTGPGLAENVQTKIFDPGYTTKGVGVGTGLGLSICYRIIVEKHGGRIWGENRLKKGAKFTIELPLKDKKELLQ